MIFDNLGPYHIARLTAAASFHQILAVEVASASTEYPWEATSQVDFARRTLLRSERRGKETNAEIVKRLRACLDDFAPEAIAIPGWSSKASLAALDWALSRGVGVVVMSETQERDFVRQPIKEWVKCRLVRMCQAALVGGTPHREYVIRLGIPSECAYTGYDAVDNRFFEQGASQARERQDEVRRRLRLPRRYFLASSRFIAKKNLDGLLRAYASFRKISSGAVSAKTAPLVGLVILGDGVLRPRLEQMSRDLGIDDDVLMPGFKQYADLPMYYGLADAFVHSSTVEQWGLVVNEAMASGLPVIVSERCGCAPDLVTEGRNGYTFNPCDANALARLMLKLALNPEMRRSMGRSSVEMVAGFSPSHFARGLSQAAEAARGRRANISIIDRALLWGLLRA